MSVLELNLRAKKTMVEKPKVEQVLAPPDIPIDGIKLEVGKKYVLNNGWVVGPLEIPTEHPDRLCAKVKEEKYPAVRYWDQATGIYSSFDKDHPKTIRREWHTTWQEEEAWMAGRMFEYYYKPGDAWYSLGHSYKVICDVFGKDSKTTKEWWIKNMAATFMSTSVRVKV
jgi:hypothetical protein